ncbi:hypothetical protein GCM10008967_38500 [Bacillus carboniphilus]|uniref:Lipoprotein n=1 Tax=Bacillus carboniphilus TaxID=86663 RepID=A0ABN0WQS6_9BACI
MLKIKLLPVILFLSLIVMGCQNNSQELQNKNLDLNDEVTSIEVYEWNGEELITTIDDKELIEGLINELDNAKTHSTAHIDWALPDYELHFKHNNEVIYEIGYCKDIQRFGDGAVGRYWEFDQLYEVNTKLPVE